MSGCNYRIVMPERVSKTSQCSGRGLKEQRDAMWREAVNRDLIAEGSADNVEIFTEVKSAGRYRIVDRPEFCKALETVCSYGNNGILMARNVSRLVRHVDDAEILKDRLRKAGAGLIIVQQSISTILDGERAFDLAVKIAQGEWEAKRYYGRKGVEKRRKAGKYVGAVPFGWTMSNGVLVPDRKEEMVISRMRHLSNQGLSCGAIAKELNKAGYRSKRGGDWSRKTVEDVLEKARIETALANQRLGY